MATTTLIYGDGAVTPAVSVLSAIEGPEMATPAVESYVLRQAHLGFMDGFDVPAVITTLGTQGFSGSLADGTYDVGHPTIVQGGDRRGLPVWLEARHAVLERNSTHLVIFLTLPLDRTAELGRQITT